MFLVLDLVRLECLTGFPAEDFEIVFVFCRGFAFFIGQNLLLIIRCLKILRKFASFCRGRIQLSWFVFVFIVVLLVIFIT